MTIPLSGPSISRRTAILLVGSAVPIAYAMETAVRALLTMPPEILWLREQLQPFLTRVAWWLFGASFPAALLGLWVQRVMARRMLARLPPEATPAQAERAELEAYFLASSVPQIPALLATVTSLGGGSPGPVVATLVVSTIGVVAQGMSCRMGAGAGAGAR